MDDLISRQAAIDAMSCINDSICAGQAIDALCELPSVQPERKTGKWIDRGLYALGYDCSKCKKTSIDKTDFCPMCGSYNGGETNDDK